MEPLFSGARDNWVILLSHIECVVKGHTAAQTNWAIPISARAVM